MAKFSIPVIAMVLGAGIVSAFAPVPTTRTAVAPLQMSAVVENPMAPLTVWGDRIPDILESQK